MAKALNLFCLTRQAEAWRKISKKKTGCSIQNNPFFVQLGRFYSSQGTLVEGK